MADITGRLGAVQRSVLMNFLLLSLLTAAFNRLQAEIPTLTNQWSVFLGKGCDSSPAVAPDGTIYFGTFQGDLYALTQAGARKWIFHAGREIQSSPAIGSDGTVYFGCRNRKFYAVNPSGQKKWEFTTGGWIDSSPAIGMDETIYFGSWDKSFYAVTAAGIKKWQFQTAGEIESSPAIGAEGTIYFGSHDHKFYSLTPDGRKLWEYDTGSPIISSPAIDKDNTLYITSVLGMLYGINSDGTLKWKLKTGGITEASPIIGQDGTIFVGVNEKLWAIAPDGEKKWERPGAFSIRSAALALADNSVCLAATDGYLLNVEGTDKCNWVFHLGYGAVSPSMGVDRAILAIGHVFNVGFELYALPNSMPLPRSPWPKFRGNPQNNGRKSS